MKLQVKLNGSWRDVCPFEEGHLAIVEDAAWRIALCSPQAAWRIQPPHGDARYLVIKERAWRTIEEQRFQE